VFDEQLITIKPELWEAIRQRAAAQDLSTEAWLKAQVAVEPAVGPNDPDEALLELVVKHFRDLSLSQAEQSALAEAMFRTLDSGERFEAGAVGMQRRRYRFHRRAGSLMIRIGQGAVELALPQAARLATWLHGDGQPQVRGDMAA
jgi:hypothetical protein